MLLCFDRTLYGTVASNLALRGLVGFFVPNIGPSIATTVAAWFQRALKTVRNAAAVRHYSVVRTMWHSASCGCDTLCYFLDLGFGVHYVFRVRLQLFYTPRSLQHSLFIDSLMSVEALYIGFKGLVFSVERSLDTEPYALSPEP